MGSKERLVELRKNLGLTQAQMAEKIRVTRSYYSLLETGQKLIVKKTLSRLRECLNVNPVWIETGGDAPMFIEPTSQLAPEGFNREAATQWLLERYSQLPPQLQEDLYQFAEKLIEKQEKKP